MHTVKLFGWHLVLKGKTFSLRLDVDVAVAAIAVVCVVVKSITTTVSCFHMFFFFFAYFTLSEMLKKNMFLMNNITRLTVGLLVCCSVELLLICFFVNVNMDKLFNLTRQVKGCSDFYNKTTENKKELKIKSYLFFLYGLCVNV